ncbi:MAG: LysE family translocator [Pseudomonadota bacterium]
MPPLESMIAVALAGIALSATPGPSMLYVLSRSVGQSRAAGLASAVGLGLGGILLAVATAMGLAAVFAKFDWLVTALRYVGSAYLIWLGLSMIRDANTNANVQLEVEKLPETPIRSIVWQGILVELLNPKTVLFFALFLPPFVSASAGDGSVQWQLLILGALVPLTAVPSDLLIAFMGGTVAQTINRQKGMRVALAWIGGCILIAIALNLHLNVI